MVKIKIRQAELSDLKDIIRIEKETWPKGTEATEEMFQSRIETFPKGVYVAEYEGKIVGVVAFELINYDDDHIITTWKKTTDNGLIKKSHNPKGNTIFGIDLTATPSAPRGTGTRLLAEVGRMAIAYNLKRGILGGRLPQYKKYAQKMSPEEYLNARDENGRSLDPEIRFYKRAGLKIGKILPNYFEDPDSLNYGVLLIWDNPFYAKRKIGKPFKKLLGKILFPLYLRSLGVK